MKDHNLILIDASWVIYRMWYVHQELSVTLSDGQVIKTGHVYGCARLMKSLTEKYPKSDIIFVLDGYARHGKELSSDYKADRGSDKTAFTDLGAIVECVAAFPRTSIAFHKDLEADEIMAYYARSSTRYDKIIVYSGDGDMLQLLKEDDVYIANEFDSDGYFKLVDKDVYYNDEKYIDKFMGTRIDVLPLYRAMVGDSSDNLAGFPRLRRKVAKQIAETYGSVEAIKGGIEAGDPLFPKGFDTFMDSLAVNYEIMKLPTVSDLGNRGTIPKLYKRDDSDIDEVVYLYSLFRIRSVSPVSTHNLTPEEEFIALSVRDYINASMHLEGKY